MFTRLNLTHDNFVIFPVGGLFQDRPSINHWFVTSKDSPIAYKCFEIDCGASTSELAAKLNNKVQDYSDALNACLKKLEPAKTCMHILNNTSLLTICRTPGLCYDIALAEPTKNDMFHYYRTVINFAEYTLAELEQLVSQTTMQSFDDYLAEQGYQKENIVKDGKLDTDSDSWLHIAPILAGKLAAALTKPRLVTEERANELMNQF